jgi:hypothetical protein
MAVRGVRQQRKLPFRECLDAPRDGDWCGRRAAVVLATATAEFLDGLEAICRQVQQRRDEHLPPERRLRWR